jgi:hypothetical protein
MYMINPYRPSFMLFAFYLHVYSCVGVIWVVPCRVSSRVALETMALEKYIVYILLPQKIHIEYEVAVGHNAAICDYS